MAQKRIERNEYLEKLKSRMGNGLIKVVTGIRRSGKSFLLNEIFYDYLIEQGVPSDHILKISLDKTENIDLHDDKKLDEYIRSKITDSQMYYVVIDEVQLAKGFELVLTGLLYEDNIDVYVTGSNSKFLSSDVITEFRGRGDEVHVMPLSFAEYYSGFEGDKNDAWLEYMTFGGLPQILTKKTDEDKSRFLKDQFNSTYIKDIVERNKIQRVDVLDSLINILSSAVGSLTNPQKIYDTFKSNGEKELSLNTINSYLTHLENAYLITKVNRYDVKGRKYIETPLKYYFSDIGLRNARINFRQQEENHIMENIIYNELVLRGYNVDVGVVPISDEKGKTIQTEVDFVCNLGTKKIYIQSALNLDTRDKTLQEERPLLKIKDNFKKIIIVKDSIKPWYTEEGILIVGIKEFLLDKEIINY